MIFKMVNKLITMRYEVMVAVNKREWSATWGDAIAWDSIERGWCLLVSRYFKAAELIIDVCTERGAGRLRNNELIFAIALQSD